jgi:hypothetical protein
LASGSPRTRRTSTSLAPVNEDPGERANAQLRSWKVLRSCPARATELVDAVQVLILAG